MPLQVFPLTGGMNQGYDVRLLPDGVLANAVNCELERIGRIVGRAKYTAVGTGVLQSGAGAFVAYDLAGYQDRLFAIGDDSRFGCPANLFEYMGSGVAQPWRPVSPLGATPRLPLATRVRDLSRPPDQPAGAVAPTAAALGGFTALAWNSFNVARNGFLLVSRAESDQPVHFAQLSTTLDRPCQHLRLVALSDRFILVGTAIDEQKVSLASFTPASSTALTQLGQDVMAAITGNVLSIAACKVTGADEFVVVTGDLSGNTRIARFSNAGVDSGVTYGPIATGATQVSVEASATANEITVAQVVGGECRLFSFNLTTGAQIGVGPFVPFSGDTSAEISLVRVSSTNLEIVSSITSGTTPTVKMNQYTVSTNALLGSSVVVTDAQLCTGVGFVSATSQLLFGARHTVARSTGTFSNLLMSGELNIGGGCIEIAKDFEAAAALGGQSRPEFVQDASTGKWYWCNAAADTDGLAFPQITEFSFGSTERRQTAEVGGHLYIAGGCPLVFDGSSAVESGFQSRPRIISVTPSNGAGTLLNSAEYDYRLHWSWIDAKGDLHLSPPSVITTVTMGASDDTNAIVGSSPHSLRRNLNSSPGSAVCLVLSRTLASVTLTAAVITGTRSIDPPDSSLSGLTLVVKAGGTTWTVTFTVAATTAAQILSEINATVNPLKLVATAPNGLLVLTSVATGDTATVQVISGTGLTLLGLTAGDLAQGETTRTKGENFQRAATAYNAIADAVADYVTVTDFRHDESDPIVDSDLIRQQVLYSQGIASGAHHAPPPSDGIWAGKERLGFFRQNTRSRWTVSKLIVPGEPAECAAAGFLQFSGQVSGDIEAGAFVGGALVLWTRKQIWLVTGDGPRRNGVGEFNQADCITRSIGLIADGWQSLVQDDEGVWFQGSDGEIYRISNGGQLEWLGKPVREYLNTYPKVVAAVYRQSKREVAFAVTTSNGSSGGILRRNALVPDAPAWFFDDVGAVASLAEYQGRLAYVQAGIVYLQDASPGSGTFPTMQLDSGLFQGFQGLGYGALQELGVLATFRGRCTITLKLGTDGLTFPDTIASWPLTASEYAVGQRVQLTVDSPKQEYDAFQLRAEVSDGTGTTEGAWLHAFAVKTESKPDFVRLAPSRRL